MLCRRSCLARTHVRFNQLVTEYADAAADELSRLSTPLRLAAFKIIVRRAARATRDALNRGASTDDGVSCMIFASCARAV